MRAWRAIELQKKDFDSCLIAWATAYTSFHGGNEVAIAKNNKLISILLNDNLNEKILSVATKTFYFSFI